MQYSFLRQIPCVFALRFIFLVVIGLVLWGNGDVPMSTQAAVVIADERLDGVAAVVRQPSVDAAIGGVLVDRSGEVITELDGWIEARVITDNRTIYQRRTGTTTIKSLSTPNAKSRNTDGAPIVNGRFNLQLPEGEYELYVRLDLNNDFSQPPTQFLTVTAGKGQSLHISVTPRVSPLGGMLLDTTNRSAISGIAGQVIGWSGENIAFTEINSEFGSFSLLAEQGPWKLSVSLTPDSLYVPLPGSITSYVGAQHTATLPVPLPVVAKNGQLKGRLIGPDGTAVPDLPVIARSVSESRHGLWIEGVTDAAGHFTIDIPAGKFWLATQASAGLWIQPSEQLVAVPTNGTTEIPLLSYTNPTRVITGEVTFSGQNGSESSLVEPISGQIQAWSNAGGFVRAPIVIADQGMATSEGTATSATYELGITSNADWTIQAVVESNTHVWRSDAIRAPGFAQQRLDISATTISTTSEIYTTTFDAGQSHQIVLGNGQRIYIPANAVDAEGLVTVHVVPVADLPNQHHVQVITDGYGLLAFNEKNEPFANSLRHPIAVYMPFASHRQAIASDASELRPAVYNRNMQTWSLLEHFSIDEESGEVAFLLNNLAEFAVISHPLISTDGHQIIGSEDNNSGEAPSGGATTLYLPTISGQTSAVGAGEPQKVHRVHIPLIQIDAVQDATAPEVD